MRPKKYSDAEILSLTRNCLLREGGNVSTQTIALELGVSQAMLFKRFGTKQRLLLSALSSPERIQILLSSLEESPTTEPVFEQMMKRCRLLLHFYNYMVPGWTILLSIGLQDTLLSERESPPIRAREAMTQWIERLQNQGLIRPCSAESIALSLLGTMYHRAFRKHVLKDRTMRDSEETFLQSTVELFWLGLMPKGA